MKLHFVCYGNTYRSRLAEAYSRFILRKYRDIEISSSGLRADASLHGPISWYAMKIIYEKELVPFMSLSPIRTTEDLLKNQDYVVYMEKGIYDQALRYFPGFKGQSEYWDVLDLVPSLIHEPNPTKKSSIIMETASQTFDGIKEHCDRLISDMSISEEPCLPW